MVPRALPAVVAAAACLAGAAVAGAEPVTLTGTIRDFSADFHEFGGPISGLTRGLVSPTLSPGGAPTLSAGWTTGAGGITGPESFARWYSPDHDAGATTQHAITLTESATEAGLLSYRSTAFFPIDDQLLGNGGREHNFYFTYEVRTTFVYQPGQFIRAGGDDDLWIFINNELALDVGGVHSFEGDEVSLDSLGLTPGQVYSFDLFYAERHRFRAELWLETNIGTFDPRLIPLPAAGAMAAAGIGLLGTRRRRALP